MIPGRTFASKGNETLPAFLTRTAGGHRTRTGTLQAFRRPSALKALPLLLLGLAAARAAETAPSTPTPVPLVETVIVSDSAEIQSTDSETTSDFKGHVIVTGTNMRMTCDRLIVVTTRVTDKAATIGNPNGFKSLLAIGHVHMQQNDGLREADCGQAEVFPASDKIVLTHDPVVIDRGNGSRATGEVLEIYKGQRRITGKHVTVTMPPVKDLGFDKNQKAGTPDAAPATPSAGIAPSAETAPSASTPLPPPPAKSE